MQLSLEMTMALDARCCLAMSKFIADKEESERMELAAYEHAYALGLSSYRTGHPATLLLAGEPALLQECEAGRNSAAHAELLDELYPSGTEEEWNALSRSEQAEEWEEFHSLCAVGIGDTMYFYDLLMSKHLVGYVGH